MERARDEFGTDLGPTQKVANSLRLLSSLCLENRNTSEAWAYSDSSGQYKLKPEEVLDDVEDSVDGYYKPGSTEKT